MKRKIGGFVMAAAVALTLGPAHLQGQWRGPFRGPGDGPNMGRSLAVLLEQQEEFGLSQEQRSQLQDLKAIMDGEVEPLAEEMRALRDQMRAGEVDRAEGFRQMEVLRGGLITASAPLRGRIQEILTVEQHRQLQRTMWEGRPGSDRWGALRNGNRVRGPGGILRGGRGGFGPRQAVYGQGRVPAFGFRGTAPGDDWGRVAPGPSRIRQGGVYRRGFDGGPPVEDPGTGGLSLQG